MFFDVHSTSERGAISWTCVKDHIIDEKEDYKDIALNGFEYNLFEE